MSEHPQTYPTTGRIEILVDIPGRARRAFEFSFVVPEDLEYGEFIATKALDKTVNEVRKYLAVSHES